MNIIRNDLGTRLNNWFDSLEKDFDNYFMNNGKKLSQLGYPRVDVSETDSDITIEASLTGVKKEDITLQYSENMLTIGGTAQDRRDAKYHKTELCRSSFCRSFLVPENLFDIDNVSAKMDSGLLVVKIPKRTKQNPKNKVINLNID